MIKVLLFMILLPFLVLAGIVFALVFPPTRRLVMFLLGRQISKATQRGRMRMEVRTWRFGSPHFGNQSLQNSNIKYQKGTQQVILDPEFVPELRDVSPTNSDPSRF